MAKTIPIEIVDTQLYYSLLDIWRFKDYSKDGTTIRNVTTEIEVRSRIGAFKIVTGMLDSKRNRIELEGVSKTVIIRRRTGEEEHFERLGIPIPKQVGTGSIDLETKIKFITPKGDNIPYDPDGDLPF